MINIKNYTKAVKQILEGAINDTPIKRNVARNDNPELANKGWIGIYKKSLDFEVGRIGPEAHNVLVAIDVEVQYSSIDQEVLENKLGTLEDLVLTTLMSAANKKLPLNGVFQVGQLKDIDVNYQLFTDEETEAVHFQSSIITFTYEVQA